MTISPVRAENECTSSKLLPSNILFALFHHGKQIGMMFGAFFFIFPCSTNLAQAFIRCSEAFADKDVFGSGLPLE